VIARALLAFAVLITGGAAMAGPLTIAGGTIDPAFPDRDVYLQTPPSAPVPSGKACQLAARYVELINSGDYLGAAALFHDDATFLEPMRPSLKGRAQIDEFYTKTIGGMKPHVIAVAYTGNDRECMVALANRTMIEGKPRYYLASVDHFILREDGKVDSMVAFARPR
jgi:ketosteroid isomerase-like protein